MSGLDVSFLTQPSLKTNFLFWFTLGFAILLKKISGFTLHFCPLRNVHLLFILVVVEEAGESGLGVGKDLELSALVLPSSTLRKEE